VAVVRSWMGGQVHVAGLADADGAQSGAAAAGRDVCAGVRAARRKPRACRPARPVVL